MAAISLSRRVSTSSKTLYIRRASFGISPSASAAQMPSVSGRQREVRASTRRNSSGVEIGKSGLQITTGRCGMGVTGVSRSPRPSASIVPPATQYGTSEPTSAPSSSSCAQVKPAPVSRLSARSTAAASDEPPPSPAHTGMRLCSRICTPQVSPARSRNTCAARTATLSAPQGR